jgi:trehalose-phosphatase
VTEDVKKTIAELTGFHRRGGELALLSDFDGTLAPIAPRPDSAVLPPQIRKLLAQWLSCPRTHLGIISGRRLDELKRLVALPHVCYAGVAGMELELHGRRVAHPRAAEAAAATAELMAQFAAHVAGCPGAWLENKGLALAVHYRGAAAEAIAALRRQVLNSIAAANKPLRAVEGPLALEISLDLGWDKGTAARMMLDSLNLGGERLRAVYGGDNGNDAPAFAAMAELGGIAVGIGPDAPAGAKVLLPNAAAWHGFIRRLTAAIALAGGETSWSVPRSWEKPGLEKISVPKMR